MSNIELAQDMEALPEEEELTVEYWNSRLSDYDKWAEKWEIESEKVEKVYFQEASSQAVKPTPEKPAYNILYSNTQTLQPALYANTPKVEVERLVRDERGGAGRTAAIILERATQREMTDHGLDEGAKSAVLDYLLTARGTAWVCYERKTEMQEEPIGIDPMTGLPIADPLTGQPITQPVEKVVDEKTRVDFVRWSDFKHSPCQEWSQNWWVSRTIRMGKQEITDMFGPEVAKRLYGTLDDNKANLKRNKNLQSTDDKVAIEEIWNKNNGKRYFMCAEYKEEFLRVEPVPIKLTDFWPCPKPLMGVRLTKDFLPKPEYQFYKLLAERLQQIMSAINQIIPAVAIRGTYDKSVPELANIFSKPGFANITPVDNFAGLRDKGGLAGAIDLIDIIPYTTALTELFRSKDQVMQMIYEITGIGDIIRGQSDPNETLGAQQIKGQWASLRIRNRQKDVQAFIRDIVRIAGEIIADVFEPDRILVMAGDLGDDQQYAAEAIQLLQNDELRHYRITIETDSTIEPDNNEEKARRTEFLGAVTGFMEKAGAILQMAPNAAPLMGEMLKFGVRGFNVGRQLEQAIDNFVATSLSAPQMMPSMTGAQGVPQSMLPGGIMPAQIQSPAEGALNGAGALPLPG